MRSRLATGALLLALKSAPAPGRRNAFTCALLVFGPWTTMVLFGRDSELAELDDRLRTHRLVTIVGPGGVGKTALADEAAKRAGERFPLGTHHRVDLTRVDAADAVAGALAAQLGFDSFDALLDSPGDRAALLVVDNCEHLLEAAATAIIELLEACQQPIVIATSRSPLGLPGEAVLSLAPLAVPRVADTDPASFPAVQLFLQRARSAGATVGTDDPDVVADLCRRLDGLPLALEIAAARARTMSVAEIAARLAASVDVLDRPRFRGVPRHRSIAETIRWSYDLLDQPATELFERLAVFAGPFLSDTACRVVGFAADHGRFEVLLDELVDASLVAVDTSGAKTRYRLLDTVRRFALEELSRRGDLDATYDRFADDALQSAQRTLAASVTVWRPELLRELLDSYDDIGEAVRWCNRHDDEPERALALCAVLWAVVQQGRADDIVVLARQTLDRWPDVGDSGAAAVATLATAEYVGGHPERALEVAERRLARLPGSTPATVTLMLVIGQARRALGDDAGTIDVLRRGAAVAREIGMTAMALELEVDAAEVEADTGRVDEALATIAAARDESISIGSVVNEVWARTAEARVRSRVDAPTAIALIDDALTRSRAIGYPIAIVANLRSLAVAQTAVDDLTAATATVSDLLDELLARGALTHIRPLVEATALLAHRVGHPAGPALAATAQSLPISLLASTGTELLGLPTATASPIPRRHVIAAVKSVLTEINATLTPPLPVAASASEEPTNGAAILAHGDSWEVRYGGRTANVRASKGLHDLARLLGSPGRDIHCLDLIGAGAHETSTGELIDAAARRRYEQRIRELYSDVDDAERDNDFVRAERAQTELDQLVEHLAGALGHGGRARRAPDSAERARSAVTHRLRATIRQVAELHPDLGRHLRASISTGTYCTYRPEHPTIWDVE